MDDDFEFIGECGFVKPVSMVTLDDIPTILRSACMEYVILRSSHEMDQFLEGLDTLGVASLLKQYPSALRQLFMYSSRRVRPYPTTTASILSPRQQCKGRGGSRHVELE